MSAFLSEALQDSQTSILCLGGAVAGAAADKLGSMVVGAAGLRTSSGVGSLGLDFVTRAVVSAAVFDAAVMVMPETSGNILFSIIFFAANPNLIRDAVEIGRSVVGTLSFMTKGPAPPRDMMPPTRTGAVDDCACKH